jgi:hypothetical protein
MGVWSPQADELTLPSPYEAEACISIQTNHNTSPLERLIGRRWKGNNSSLI